MAVIRGVIKPLIPRYKAYVRLDMSRTNLYLGKRMKHYTASQLRENVYRILDHIQETGEPVEIHRNGVVLKIVPPKPVSKLSRLKKRNGLRVDPESIVHMNWEKEWKPS